MPPAACTHPCAHRRPEHIHETGTAGAFSSQERCRRAGVRGAGVVRAGQPPRTHACRHALMHAHNYVPARCACRAVLTHVLHDTRARSSNSRGASAAAPLPLAGIHLHGDTMGGPGRRVGRVGRAPDVGGGCMPGRLERAPTCRHHVHHLARGVYRAACAQQALEACGERVLTLLGDDAWRKAVEDHDIRFISVKFYERVAFSPQDAPLVTGQCPQRVRPPYCSVWLHS